MQIYLMNPKIGEIQISYSIIFRPQRARARAYIGNI